MQIIEYTQMQPFIPQNTFRFLFRIMERLKTRAVNFRKLFCSRQYGGVKQSSNVIIVVSNTFVLISSCITNPHNFNLQFIWNTIHDCQTKYKTYFNWIGDVFHDKHLDFIQNLSGCFRCQSFKIRCNGYLKLCIRRN